MQEYWSGLIFPSPRDTCVHEVAQLCLTLCNPMDCSPPGPSVHGIFQARVLEWVAISFSRGSSQPRDWTQVSCIAGRRFTIWSTREELQGIFLTNNHIPFCEPREANIYTNTCVLSHFSHVYLFSTLWTVAYQAPLSMGFPKQEYWSRLPFPSPGDLPDPVSPIALALAGGFSTAEPPGKLQNFE